MEGSSGSKLMTVPDAADMLAVSRESIRRWVRAGTLRGTLVGRQYRVLRADVEAILARAESTGELNTPEVVGELFREVGELANEVVQAGITDEQIEARLDELINYRGA